MASPAFGGGGTGEGAVGVKPATGGVGIAPGCGAGGDWEVVEGKVVVGVAALPALGGKGAAVGAGRLAAAPGSGGGFCDVAYIGEYEGAVAVAEVLGGWGAVVDDSIAVAGSSSCLAAAVDSSFWFEFRGAEVYVGMPDMVGSMCDWVDSGELVKGRSSRELS